MKLKLSSTFSIDTDDYKREGLRFSILAMSGHGKSNAAADIVEDVLEQHGQVIIIEPIPEWHTLKARFNTVVVIGGPYQDLPLEAAFAHEYVKAALEKGISLVVNISDIEDDVEQLHFVSSFLWNLYRLEQKYRRVLFLVLEEADIYAPQSWDQTSKQSLSRVSLIAKHGRKIGIFPILISQRPADLHKSPLSQCNINLFGKFTSPADLDPKTGLMFLVKKQHLPITEDQIMKLPTGSFIVAHKGGVDTIAVRKRSCPHGADTPLIEAKPFTADLSQALGTLRDDIAKAIACKKDEDSIIKRQEKEITQLKQTVKQLEDKVNIKLSLKEMMEGNGNEALQAKIIQLSEELDGLKKTMDEQSIQTDLNGYSRGRADSETELEEKNTQIERLTNENKAFSEFKAALAKLVSPAAVPVTERIELQKVITVIPLEPVKRVIPKILTVTVKGKILTAAQSGFFSQWRTMPDLNKELTEKYAWTCSPQQLSQNLTDLVDKEILGVRREKDKDLLEYKLSANVSFADGQI